MARRCGAVVVNALLDIAVDRDLYRFHHWNGAQAKRAHQQLHQPIRPLLGAGVWFGQFDDGLQRVVVHADFGFLGHQHQLVCHA